VVYDSVGRDTFMKSLDCLEFRGTCLLYGLSSGQVDLFDPTELSIKGCLYLSRPSTHQYHPTPEIFRQSAMEVFDVIRSGAVKPHIGQRYPLKNVAEAHLALEQRRTIGATVLIP
jgi:NADPH2:quinone reductase